MEITHERILQSYISKSTLKKPSLCHKVNFDLEFDSLSICHQHSKSDVADVVAANFLSSEVSERICFAKYCSLLILICKVSGISGTRRSMHPAIANTKCSKAMTKASLKARIFQYIKVKLPSSSLNC